MNPNNEEQKIVFEGEEFQRSFKSFQERQTPKIIEWIIKYSGGYITDAKQANYLLIGFVIVMLILSFFLIFNSSESINNSNNIKITPAII